MLGPKPQFYDHIHGWGRTSGKNGGRASIGGIFGQLPVVETQAQLEAVVGRFFVYEHDEYENPNLTTALAHESRALDAQIVRIVGIDRL